MNLHVILRLYVLQFFSSYYFSLLVIPRFKKNRRILLSTLEHVKGDRITFNVTKNKWQCNFFIILSRNETGYLKFL